MPCYSAKRFPGFKSKIEAITCDGSHVHWQHRQLGLLKITSALAPSITSRRLASGTRVEPLAARARNPRWEPETSSPGPIPGKSGARVPVGVKMGPRSPGPANRGVGPPSPANQGWGRPRTGMGIGGSVPCHQLDWAPAPFDRSESATHLVPRGSSFDDGTTQVYGTSYWGQTKLLAAQAGRSLS